ncbi:DNA adenine methylase [Humibacter sp.]|uniref:DNA adenine methylase n=1 Tax=Humibacter sp. TaxID=1940291 RepID=UPI003F81F4A1
MKPPFPYFGGKGRAAALIWDSLGDPGGYVEPFAGSAAVLLARPAFKGRRVETINDLDGWLINMWRAVRADPASVAEHASGPVAEIDYHARLAWLQERRTDGLVSWLEGDPEVFDAKAAGWWLYVAACGIGDPWGSGPWRVVDGRLVDVRKLPHLGNAGRGVNREMPHLGDAGQGLIDYMMKLSRRLANVRITCGDWRRVLKPSVTRATATKPGVGILLDPPYATSSDLYAVTNQGGAETVAEEVRDWCMSDAAGMRVVLCGFEDEHDELLEHGWSKITGKAGGGAGYNTDQKAGRRERLWLSPECQQAHPALFPAHDEVRSSGWSGSEQQFDFDFGGAA